MVERFVIDNTIVMTRCFEDEASQYGDAVLNSLAGAEAVVPSIWPLEVINVLLVAKRRDRLHESDNVRFTSLLSSLPRFMLNVHGLKEQ